MVEHKDRLTRFGAKYIEILLSETDRRLEIVNGVPDDKEDLITDESECHYIILCKAVWDEKSKAQDGKTH